MDEARRLIYCDKNGLKSFATNDIAYLNKLIYDFWLTRRTEIDPFDANCRAYYLKAFNDAYYVCTTALLLPEGLHLTPYYLGLHVERPSIVFPMVHLYLSHLTEKSRGIWLFINQLETKFKKDPQWGENYSELQEVVCEYKGNIDPATFAQRKLTKEILSEINWEQLTKKYDKESIESVLRNFARTKEVWTMMCDAIKEAAIAYDYDYGFEDYEQEDISEEGIPYSHIVKVPRQPYGRDGEYILEPLKRGGVYDFCDELKQRFDELVLTSQPLSDSEVNLKNGKENPDTESCCFKFDTPFVKERVKEAIKECGSEKAKLALLEMTLYDHGFLKSRNDHTPFLRQLVDWGMLPSISEAEDKEGMFKKTVNGVRTKAKSRKLVKGYMDWDENSKDRVFCEALGKILGETMPYRR